MSRSTTIMLQFTLLVVNPALLLAQIAIVLSGVHFEKTICLPSSVCHWWLLLQVATACATLPATVSLFRKAYYSHCQSTPTLLSSAFNDGGGQSWGTTKSTGSRKSGEAESRQLDWLFQGSHDIEDDRVRELILRNTGAWDCTALPQIHRPFELLESDANG